MLELYHHGSSVCAAKVRFALGEKQLAWTSHYLDILKGEQFAPEFLTINAKGVVPVLVHDGQIIVESTVICEYVEEAFPANPIYPTSPVERAAVRVWTKGIDEELHPGCSAITYAVSHRHTILRNGVGSFDDFLREGASEGLAARALKWQWIQQGLEAPGVIDKIRLYDHYLHRMEEALEHSDWLVGSRFSMADIGMTPYVNRLAALSMHDMWRGGRLPSVENWFERIQARAAFKPALAGWVPADLATEMHENGEKSWHTVRAMLSH